MYIMILVGNFICGWCAFFSFIITTINVGGLVAVCILWDAFHILQSDDFGLWFCSFNWIVIRCCFDVCICIWADVRVCMWWNAYLSSSLDKPSIHFDYPIFDAHKFCGSLSVLTDFEMHRAIGANLLLRDTHTHKMTTKRTNFVSQHDARRRGEFFWNYISPCWL